MNETTARLALPLIAPGQAQKELTHNEALALIDLAVQPAVVAVGIDVPPEAPAIGQAWIVGAAPTGAWAGHARALAGWTQGGWRFVAARAGMTATRVDGAIVRFVGGGWMTPDDVAAPEGGATVDAEARATLSALIDLLREHGLIAG